MLLMSKGVLAVNRISSGVHALASVFKATKPVTKFWIVGMVLMRRTAPTENTFAGQTNLNVLMAAVFHPASGVIEWRTARRERMNRTVSFSADLMSLLARMEDASNKEIVVMTLLIVMMGVMNLSTATVTCWESFPARLLGSA